MCWHMTNHCEVFFFIVLRLLSSFIQIGMEIYNAHQVAERAVLERGHPPLSGVITDADVWPALSVAIHRPVVVMDGATHGRLYQPSIHEKSQSDPGQPVTVQQDFVLSVCPMRTTDVLLIHRTGMNTYQMPLSNVHHDLQHLARRVGILHVSSGVYSGVEGYLCGWLRDVISCALLEAINNHRDTVGPVDVAMALGP